jgi:hypothetical protein
MKGKIFLFLLMLVGLFALWTFITLSFTYSTGNRAGFLQKFSKKGFICKTWEGEIVTGSMMGNAEKFEFSVRDDALAQEVASNIGKRIEIQYDQHLGVPSKCFAESEYFVKSVKSVPDLPSSLLQQTIPQAPVQK